MNSLHTTGDYIVKSMIALIFVSLLTLATAAQRVEPQSQGRMYGDPGFRGEPVNLNVVNADVRDILNYITEQYGVNFVIDKSVKSTPVTINVSEVPWNLALDAILKSQELGIQVNGPILRVADVKTLATEGEIVRQQLDNNLDGSPLYTEFIRLNYARASGSNPRGSATSGTASGSSSGGGTGGGDGLLPIIKRRLSRRGSIETDSRSNSLIITDVRQNIDAIRQLVAILDQPEPQVEIEARVVAATRKFSRDMGIQLAAIVAGPRGSGGVGGTLPGFQSDVSGSPTIPNPTIGSGSSLASQLVNSAIGLTTGVFGTAQISAMITAGEQQQQLKTIATPRVTTLNNRQAKIESKTQIPITTVQPGTGGGAAIATTTYVDVPLKLEITPQITDVGTVVLDVLAENASTAAFQAGTAPAINSQVMQSQITVPDGGTTVVGGVLFDSEQNNQDRTPGLSKIPILGNLFKRKGIQRDTVEILFFITPRIVRADYETEVAGRSGVKPNATIIQPVPLGNPPSNSGTATTTTGQPQVPVVPQTMPTAGTPQKP